MPEKPKRVNTHSSRTGTNGQPIKATHQEHNFTAEHVNPELTPNNKVLLFQKVELDPDYKTKFEQDRYEQAVYKQLFQPCLDSRNAKAEKGRHKERVQTMQQFRQNKKACPEEVLFTVGNVNNPTDPELLWEIYLEYAEWHKKAFPNVVLLSAYEHVDEPNAAPHIQQRQVWTAHEGDMLIINQSKALEEMGIERPFPDKEVSRTNNAKVTYSQMCREKQIEIARAHGLDIEDKPREPSENGKTLLQLKVKTMQKENERLKGENAKLQGQARELSERVNDLTEQAEQAEQRAADAESSLVNLLDGVPPCPQEPKEPTKSMSFTAEQAKQNAREYNAQLKAYKKAAKAYPKARKEWESKYLTPDNISKAKDMVESQRSQIQPTLARARAAEQAAASDREKAKAEKEKAEKERQAHAESVRNEALRLVQVREVELFGYDGQSRTQRLERFCEGVKYEDGSSVLDAFEQQEDERRQEYRQTSFRGR